MSDDITCKVCGQDMQRGWYAWYCPTAGHPSRPIVTPQPVAFPGFLTERGSSLRLLLREDDKT